MIIYILLIPLQIFSFTKIFLLTRHIYLATILEKGYSNNKQPYCLSIKHAQPGKKNLPGPDHIFSG